MAEEKKAKTKIPTAKKRDLQNQKKRASNKSLKSQMRSTLNIFEEFLKKQEKDAAEKALRNVFRFADKGVKKGIFKKNKAARIKSGADAKLRALAS